MENKEQEIVIGKFHFNYDLCAKGQVFITNNGEGQGEGGAFSIEEFEKVVEKFFNERF